MNQLLLQLLLLLSSTLYLPMVRAQEPSALKNQVIRGYITDHSTGKGLGKAFLKLLHYHPLSSTAADQEGYFELREVPTR